VLQRSGKQHILLGERPTTGMKKTGKASREKGLSQGSSQLNPLADISKQCGRVKRGLGENSRMVYTLGNLFDLSIRTIKGGVPG